MSKPASGKVAGFSSATGGGTISERVDGIRLINLAWLWQIGD
jgi:hypothetical protein